MTIFGSGLARHIATAIAVAVFVGLAAGATGQIKSTPQLPIAKDVPIPPGTYQQFTAKQLVTLSTLALFDPNLGEKTAVVYVHLLPKGTDVAKVAAELAPKLADGSVRALVVPSTLGDGNPKFVLTPNQNGLAQLKRLAGHANGEIGLVSFDKQITTSVETRPSRWISWDTGSPDAEKKSQ